jgi:hypothetical protein
MHLSDAVSHSGLALYAEVALVLFFLAFLIIGVRLLVRRDRREEERMRHLPLEDGEPAPKRPGVQP